MLKRNRGFTLIEIFIAGYYGNNSHFDFSPLQGSEKTYNLTYYDPETLSGRNYFYHGFGAGVIFAGRQSVFTAGH